MPSEEYITILLATYNPRMDWFTLLLDSLNNQDYKNLKLIVRDDCSLDSNFRQIAEALKEHIIAFDYKIIRNNKNIGSNATFATLIHDASTPYIAFCDQDDIWHKDKISTLYNHMKVAKKRMICSDVCVIDENGAIKAKSITRYRKRFNFFPKNQLQYLIYKNFVIGCTILMDRQLALDALPLSNVMNHDHDLAFFASYHNELIVLDQPLVDYRIHKFNQSAPLGNVYDKSTYYEHNILKFSRWITYLLSKYKLEQLLLAEEWSNARIAHYKKEKGSWRKLYSYRKVNRYITYFELFILHHKALFNLTLKLVKRNSI